MAAGHLGYPRTEGYQVPLSWWHVGDFPRRAVRWLWPHRVPMRKLTLLIGEPGVGKSLLAIDMAARITRGRPWPDETATAGGRQGASGEEASARSPLGREPAAAGVERSALGGGRPAAGVERPTLGGERPAFGGERSALGSGPRVTGMPQAPVGASQGGGSVVLLSAEDDAEDTIRPRLEAAGGDPGRVVVLFSNRRPGSESDVFSLRRDLGALEAQVRDRGDVRLVIFDPLSAYLGGLDSHSCASVRAVLAPLRGMAERTGVAVVGINHLTKRTAAAVLHRATGSIAFVAAARAVWVVGPDRRVPGRVLMLSAKSNHAGPVKGLAFRIVSSAADPEVPVIAWEPEGVGLTAEEGLGLSLHGRLGTRERAAAWLEAQLADGPKPVREVVRAAKAAGLSVPTLKRARADLEAVAEHPRPEAPWTLRLPSEEVALLGRVALASAQGRPAVPAEAAGVEKA